MDSAGCSARIKAACSLSISINYLDEFTFRFNRAARRPGACSSIGSPSRPSPSTSALSHDHRKAKQAKRFQETRSVKGIPGAWMGRWRHLKLKATYKYNNEASREDLITHVRATLAYLETNRDAIEA